MPISFDLSHYKSTFPGEIIESDVIPANGQEFLRITIAELSRDGDQQVSDRACSYPDCKLPLIRHRHQPALWESEKSGSPLHQFVESVNVQGQTNTKINFNFKDFIGKRWLFKADKQRDWVDKNTGENKTGRTYYYVAGPIDQPVDVEPEPLGDSLPFDAGHSAPAQNGTTKTTVTRDDLDLMLAVYVDGKTNTQVIQGLMMREEIPEITADESYLASIIDQSAINRLIEKTWVSKEGDAYKSSDEVKALGKD